MGIRNDDVEQITAFVEMKVSLIISTYNWEEALVRTLESVARQSRLPDEIIIADDGSREPTRIAVEQFAAGISGPVKHIWHEDDGFRLAAIRNKAMAAATGDYLIQTDGDVVLDRHFTEDHVRMAKRGCYVVGSRVVLGESISKRVLDGTQRHLHPCLPDVGNRLNGIRCTALSRLFASWRGHGARGCNMAFWREDAIATNGYDEQMRGWGHEDMEFAARLENSGIRHRSLKFGGILYHIYHRPSSRSREDENLDIFRRTVARKATRCTEGIDKYLRRDNDPTDGRTE